VQTLSRKEKIVKSLLHMGQAGHYPIFNAEWFYDCFKSIPEKPLSSKDKMRARKILQRVLMHANLDRQKTLLFSLNEEERNLFLRSFCHMVEGKILDDAPQIH
jgi:hypothetical protein